MTTCVSVGTWVDPSAGIAAATSGDGPYTRAGPAEAGHYQRSPRIAAGVTGDFAHELGHFALRSLPGNVRLRNDADAAVLLVDDRYPADLMLFHRRDRKS